MFYMFLQWPPDGPKNTSVISSPSGEIEEGRSVTLSCSSDANPAANYTWFKEHEDSVGESGQNYTITHITSQLGGNYYCQAHNAVGRHNSTFLFIHVTGNCLFKRHAFDAEYQWVKFNYLSTQSNTGLSMLQFVISAWKLTSVFQRHHHRLWYQLLVEPLPSY